MDWTGNSLVQYMWTEQGTVWYSVCGLDREQFGTVYVDQTGNVVVQCMWTGQGTLWYSIFEPDKEQRGSLYVDWTWNCVVQCIWPEQGKHCMRTEKITEERLHIFSFSPYDIRILNSRCIRWAGNVALIKEIKIQEYFSDDLKGRDFALYNGLYGITILTVISSLCRRLAVRLLKGNNSSRSVQDRHCTCDVMLWRVRLTGVAVGRQQVTLLGRYVPADRFRDFGEVMSLDFKV